MRALGVAVLLMIPVTQATGIAHAHDAANFSAGRYRAVEGDRNESVVVIRGTHGQGAAAVDVAAMGGTATDGADLFPSENTVTFSSPVEQAESFITLRDDAEVEIPETIELSLQRPSAGMVLAFPNRSIMTLVDDDGPTRFSVEQADTFVFESGRAVDVWVLRSGDASGESSVSYSTAGSSATEDVDYAAVAGELIFAPHQRWKKISITIMDNEGSDGNRDFTLSLGASSGAALAEPFSTRVTIRDDETDVSGDVTAPYTAFHQPLHGKRYGRKSAREILLFMQDNEGGSGMAAVKMALRKKKTGGSCAWWRGSRFRPGSCTKIQWLRQQPDLYTDLAYFKLSKALPTSTRSNGIRFYTAYSRGTDKVGNVQRKLVKGQNKNHFEVK